MTNRTEAQELGVDAISKHGAKKINSAMDAAARQAILDRSVMIDELPESTGGFGGDFTANVNSNLDGHSLQFVGNSANIVFIINDHDDTADNYIDIKCGDNVIDMQQSYVSVNAGDDTGVKISADFGINLNTNQEIKIENALETDNTLTAVLARDADGNLREVDIASLFAGMVISGTTK